MRFKISTKRLVYEFEIFGKYNILRGDSGKGKTTLYNLAEIYSDKHELVQVQSDVPLLACPTGIAAARAILTATEGALFIIDENNGILNEPDVASIFKNSRNYFLVITRDNLDYIPVSVENVWNIKESGKYHWFQPVYMVKNERDFRKPEIVITEDAGSGLKFFKEFFALTVESAKSKSKIVSKLSSLYQKDILAVFDAAGFGFQIETFLEFCKRTSKNISILDWYSFEWYILTTPQFNVILTPKDMTYEYESLEQRATEILTENTRYSKRSMHPCISTDNQCGSCNEPCQFQHSHLDIDIKFVSDENSTIFLDRR